MDPRIQGTWLQDSRTGSLGLDMHAWLCKFFVHMLPPSSLHRFWILVTGRTGLGAWMPVPISSCWIPSVLCRTPTSSFGTSNLHYYLLLRPTVLILFTWRSWILGPLVCPSPTLETSCICSPRPCKALSQDFRCLCHEISALVWTSLVSMVSLKYV